jgi:glutamine---fructose-6-phosphate transaminase (isomerizing)
MLKEITSSPRHPRLRSRAAWARRDRIDVDELDALADKRLARPSASSRRLRHRELRRAVGGTRSRTGSACPARATVGSEFRYSPPPLDERTLVIAVTQSGETADTIAPTRWRESRAARSSPSPTRSARHHARGRRGLFLQAGPEIAVASDEDVRDPGPRDPAGGGDGRAARGCSAPGSERQLADALRDAARLPAERALKLAEPADQELARATSNSRGSCSSAAAYGFPIALEGALKLKEVSYVHAEGYAAGELKHGPISLLDRRCRSSRRHALAVYEKVISNVAGGPRARRARARRGHRGRRGIDRYADDILWVPDTPEPLSPVIAVIPLQLFAYDIAVARGTDVDQPRNLAKSVTVE